MSKTFTCRELGGICDEKFSGDSFREIMQKTMGHMGSDEAHRKHVSDMAVRTNENKEQWMEKMQREFDAKPEDE